MGIRSMENLTQGSRSSVKSLWIQIWIWRLTGTHRSDLKFILKIMPCIHKHAHCHSLWPGVHTCTLVWCVTTLHIPMHDASPDLLIIMWSLSALLSFTSPLSDSSETLPIARSLPWILTHIRYHSGLEFSFHHSLGYDHPPAFLVPFVYFSCFRFIYVSVWKANAYFFNYQAL